MELKWRGKECNFCQYQVKMFCRRFPPILIKVKKYRGFNKKDTHEYRSAYPNVHIDTENAWCWMPACAEYKELTNGTE